MNDEYTMSGAQNPRDMGPEDAGEGGPPEIEGEIIEVTHAEVYNIVTGIKTVTDQYTMIVSDGPTESRDANEGGGEEGDSPFIMGIDQAYRGYETRSGAESGNDGDSGNGGPEESDE